VESPTSNGNADTPIGPRSGTTAPTTPTIPIPILTKSSKKPSALSSETGRDISVARYLSTSMFCRMRAWATRRRSSKIAAALSWTFSKALSALAACCKTGRRMPRVAPKAGLITDIGMTAIESTGFAKLMAFLQMSRTSSKKPSGLRPPVTSPMMRLTPLLRFPATPLMPFPTSSTTPLAMSATPLPILVPTLSTALPTSLPTLTAVSTMELPMSTTVPAASLMLLQVSSNQPSG